MRALGYACGVRAREAHVCVRHVCLRAAGQPSTYLGAELQQLIKVPSAGEQAAQAEEGAAAQAAAADALKLVAAVARHLQQ